VGRCDLCGQEAGLLRKRHKECESRLETGKSETIALVAQSVLAPLDLSSLQVKLAEIGQRSFLAQAGQKPLIIEGWQKAVDQALEDDILSSEEEQSLMGFADSLSLTRDDLDESGAFSRVVKAAVIRDILEGTLPQRISLVADLPFNLQKGESMVWVFPDATYYEQRIRTHYEGGSQGVSVRVARGLYYRVGRFRGHPVKTAGMVNMGMGPLGVTDRHIYFAGPTKAFRIKYDKIVSFTPYSDGIGIQRDAQTAKPQVFVTGDGWFTYNLVSNLAKASGGLTTR
jgi:hypothetical protein